MRATGVRPAKGKSPLVDGPFLHEQLVTVVKEEDTESPMRKGIWIGEVAIGMGSPLVDRGCELVIFVD
jgi:hypothetical protein